MTGLGLGGTGDSPVPVGNLPTGCSISNLECGKLGPAFQSGGKPPDSITKAAGEGGEGNF